MQSLRRFLDRLEPVFSKGGRFERFHALFEMVDTLFYSPPDVTRGSPHVRDALDLKRVMILVVFAVTPCVLGYVEYRLSGKYRTRESGSHEYRGLARHCACPPGCWI